MSESAARIDKSRSKAVVAARLKFLDAAAWEAERIGRDVDPKDRTPQQSAFLKAFVDLLHLHPVWSPTNDRASNGR